MTGELGKTWNENVLTIFKAIQMFSGETEANYEKSDSDSGTRQTEHGDSVQPLGFKCRALAD
jgi:hypothetical protein